MMTYTRAVLLVMYVCSARVYADFRDVEADFRLENRLNQQRAGSELNRIGV
jgi:hypothetical protein